jgi:hypothetical protein
MREGGMILSAHQPAYLPWLGYFDKLLRSDVFVFLDNVQYEKNSFINRNKIKTPQGAIWLTVPVKTKGHTSATLKDTEIDDSQNWKQKHLKSIWLNYRHAPRFDACYAKLEALYAAEDDLLADLCFRHLEFWLREIGVEKKIVRASGLPVQSKKSDMVLELCRHFKADYYISGALGRGYLEEEKFDRAGIRVEYQDYRHPTYPQLVGAFLPFMSILDFWMNTDRFSLISEGAR